MRRDGAIIHAVLNWQGGDYTEFEVKQRLNTAGRYPSPSSMPRRIVDRRGGPIRDDLPLVNGAPHHAAIAFTPIRASSLALHVT